MSDLKLEQTLPSPAILDRARLDQVMAELAEIDQIAIWRTRQAWAEFEDAWREYSAGRRHVVSAAVLHERRRLEPLPADHPLAQRKPWTAEQLDRSSWRLAYPYNQQAIWPNSRFPEVG